MPDVFKASLSEAVPPFVLALDVGSTASRGSLYDARGLPIAGSKLRLAHSFTTATDGTSTVDADRQRFSASATKDAARFSTSSTSTPRG